jgi:hypothetical protein
MIITPEILANRKAQREAIRKAAMKGDRICGALFELESLAHENGLGFVVTIAQDMRDPDEDDDMRPF